MTIAQQTVFFKNARVEGRYFDVHVRRGVSADRRRRGRATHGPGGRGTTPTDGNRPAGRGASRRRHRARPLPRGVHLRRHRESDSLAHRGTDPAHAGWTRQFAFAEQSQLNTAELNNRLSSTRLSGVADAEAYPYDDHGNMLEMPQLSVMRWNHRDQLRATAHDAGPTGGAPETTYYVYDSAGERVRKVTDKQRANASQAPVPLKERVYLGGVEFYREYNADGTATTLERGTLHVVDDTGRIALVERRTKGMDESPGELTRYQLGNHLGSASVELADDGEGDHVRGVLPVRRLGVPLGGRADAVAEAVSVHGARSATRRVGSAVTERAITCPGCAAGRVAIRHDSSTEPICTPSYGETPLSGRTRTAWKQTSRFYLSIYPEKPS